MDMRATQWSMMLMLVGAGCSGGGDVAQKFGLSLESLVGEPGDGDDEGGPPDVVVETDVDGGIVLDCVRGELGEVHVEFACDSITVYTCKDLSNVVIELEDGTRVRVEGLNGQVNTFSNGQRVVGVWVKAGNNKSGDGPGYGERVDAPDQDCDPPEAGSGGAGGSSGEGGEGGSDACGSNDPDEVCVDPPAGSGGTNGGEPQSCEDNPDQPMCNVE
jgi:hypothetical protein